MPSFASDVLPLFRQKDINCMKPYGVLLDSYEHMANPTGSTAHKDFANAREVLQRIDGSVLPRMPAGGPPWTNARIAVLREWIEGGCQP